MKKTSLYLEPDVDRALARMAAAEGLTKAELIRRALAETARGSGRPRLSAIGTIDGPGDVADNVDRYLTDTGFGER